MTKGLHRFRASGWTRHYETFSEILQILAAGAGISTGATAKPRRALAIQVGNRGQCDPGTGDRSHRNATVLVAFAIGASVILLRAAKGKTRLLGTAGLGIVLAFGAFVVWQTRAQDALALRDSSSSL